MVGDSGGKRKAERKQKRETKLHSKTGKDTT